MEDALASACVGARSIDRRGCQRMRLGCPAAHSTEAVEWPMRVPSKKCAGGLSLGTLMRRRILAVPPHRAPVGESPHARLAHADTQARKKHASSLSPANTKGLRDHRRRGGGARGDGGGSGGAPVRHRGCRRRHPHTPPRPGGASVAAAALAGRARRPSLTARRARRAPTLRSPRLRRARLTRQCGWCRSTSQWPPSPQRRSSSTAASPRRSTPAPARGEDWGDEVGGGRRAG